MRDRDPIPAKGLHQFLDDDQQRAWLDGASFNNTAQRPESLEQRFKYAGRLEKLLRRPQAPDVLAILRAYATACIPIPRTTERFHWSVSCLPGSPDKPLARISASFMELFALHADGDDLRSRFILHLSDFTADGSIEPDQLDHALLASCVGDPEDLSHFFWKADTFGVKVRTATSIRAFMAHPHGLLAIRRFNLTHMNRGRNAYQSSHCYSLADAMLDD